MSELNEETFGVNALVTTTEDPHPHSPEYYQAIKEIEAGKYADISLTKEEVRRIKVSIARMSTGVFASLPLTCLGEKCPHVSDCPLYEINKLPIGRKCLIELNMIEDFYKRYIIEFDIQPGEFAQLSLIDDLVTIDILLKRAYNSLGNPDMRQAQFRHLGLEDHEIPIREFQDGTIMTTMETEIGRTYELATHPLLSLIDKLTNKKQKILSSLVGTPQEKYKRDAALKQKKDSDASKNMTAMRESLNKILESKQIDAVSSTYTE